MQSPLEHAAQGKNQFKIQVDSYFCAKNEIEKYSLDSSQDESICNIGIPLGKSCYAVFREPELQIWISGI